MSITLTPMGYFFLSLYCLQWCRNIPQTCTIKQEALKDLLTSKFVIDAITFKLSNSFKSATHYALGR